MQRHTARDARHGFTLIEVLVVIVILGVLSTIVTVSVVRHQATARINATRMNIDALRAAVSMYMMEVGTFPVSLNELVVEGDKDWPGPFIEEEELPLDAWGYPFELERRGKRYRIVSGGPDGVLGTEDDLWK